MNQGNELASVVRMCRCAHEKSECALVVHSNELHEHLCEYS